MLDSATPTTRQDRRCDQCDLLRGQMQQSESRRWPRQEFELAVYLRQACRLTDTDIADVLAVAGMTIRTDSDVYTKLRDSGKWRLPKIQAESK